MTTLGGYLRCGLALWIASAGQSLSVNASGGSEVRWDPYNDLRQFANLADIREGRAPRFPELMPQGAQAHTALDAPSSAPAQPPTHPGASSGGPDQTANNPAPVPAANNSPAANNPAGPESANSFNPSDPYNTIPAAARGANPSNPYNPYNPNNSPYDNPAPAAPAANNPAPVPAANTPAAPEGTPAVQPPAPPAEPQPADPPVPATQFPLVSNPSGGILRTLVASDARRLSSLSPAEIGRRVALMAEDPTRGVGHAALVLTHSSLGTSQAALALRELHRLRPDAYAGVVTAEVLPRVPGASSRMFELVFLEAYGQVQPDGRLAIPAATADNAVLRALGDAGTPAASAAASLGGLASDCAAETLAAALGDSPSPETIGRISEILGNIHFHRAGELLTAVRPDGTAVIPARTADALLAGLPDRQAASTRRSMNAIVLLRSPAQPRPADPPPPTGNGAPIPLIQPRDAFGPVIRSLVSADAGRLAQLTPEAAAARLLDMAGDPTRGMEHVTRILVDPAFTLSQGALILRSLHSLRPDAYVGVVANPVLHNVRGAFSRMTDLQLLESYGETQPDGQLAFPPAPVHNPTLTAISNRDVAPGVSARHLQELTHGNLDSAAETLRRALENNTEAADLNHLSRVLAGVHPYLVGQIFSARRRAGDPVIPQAQAQALLERLPAQHSAAVRRAIRAIEALR